MRGGDTPSPDDPSTADRLLNSTPPTYQFRNPPVIRARTRWGTTSVKPHMLLTFRLCGFEQPLQVGFVDALLLGRAFLYADPPHLDLDSYGAYWHGVSRRHARIVMEDGAMLKIVDLGSTNGTYLNGERLHAHQPRILRDGDDLTLGRLMMAIMFE